MSNALFNTRNVQAVAELLGNRTARIANKTLDMIAVESEDVVEWHAPMVDRENLPARVIRRIATFVSAALMDKLIERHAEQADLVEELRQTVRKRIERGDFAERDSDWEPAEDRARKLFQAGGLSEAVVVNAIEAADNAFVRHALQMLAGLPFDTVSRMLNTGSGKAVTALVWKAGLSMAAAELVQRKISHVPSKKQVRATAEGGFPLSEDDLNWYLECVA